ncbi:MAG: hypothetical protein V4760_09935 [Bdellovibrionota bacterium]
MKNFKRIVLVVVIATVVVFGLALLVGYLRDTATQNRKVSYKKDLGRMLGLTPGDLVSVQTGSDSVGCSWNPLNTKEAGMYKKAVERLLRLPVYEMTPEAPEGCKTAYYAADDMNSYKFLGGRLTIPPSGQYPPPPTGVFSKYYRVSFQTGEQTEPREFCLEEKDFLMVVGVIKENPALADCEI